MYTGHFQLTGLPFAITPDPRYLFLSERHREALAHLLYGVGESGGFIQLTGEVGTGKTTLTRSLLDQLPDHVDAALVYNPRMTLAEFLETICDELHVQREPGANSPKQLTDALNRHLLAAHARGRRTVLIVDEAQNLDPDLLEGIRLLTNLETHRDKLLQILLIGQPELRDTLARNDLRQLAQRITARYHLEPLDSTETTAYIRHRLEVAGARRPLFTPGALKAVHKASGGVPRLINILCDRALLGAFADGADQVDTALVRRAAREVKGEFGHRPSLVLPVSVATVVLGVAALFGWHHLESADVTALPPVPAPTMVADPAVIAETSSTESPPFDLATALAPNDLSAAAAELLARWGIEPAAGLPASLCVQAMAQGLGCVRGRGTWNNLRMLARPALLELRTGGITQTVLLTGLDPTSATLWVAGIEHRVPLLTLDATWLGEYLLLWRAPQGAGTILRPGMEGPGVAWLQSALAQWAADTSWMPAGPVYDAATETRVRRFQLELGLEVDGIAGEQTLVHLDGLTAPEGPRLVAHP